MQILQLVDIPPAQLFLPADLKIVSVLPGKTLGGVYLATYGLEVVSKPHFEAILRSFVSKRLVKWSVKFEAV